MKISIQDLKTPRQWRSALGCDAHHFAQLLLVFRRAYEALNEMQLADRMVIHPAGTRMKDEEDLLFFTLFSCKSGLTYDVLGLVCGLDGATAKRRQDEGLAVWSRSKVGRVSVKDSRTFSPFGANEFVGRKPFKALEPFGEVISQ